VAQSGNFSTGHPWIDLRVETRSGAAADHVEPSVNPAWAKFTVRPLSSSPSIKKAERLPLCADSIVSETLGVRLLATARARIGSGGDRALWHRDNLLQRRNPGTARIAPTRLLVPRDPNRRTHGGSERNRRANHAYTSDEHLIDCRHRLYAPLVHVTSSVPLTIHLGIAINVVVRV
jgi:hypothetical protein